MGTLQKILVPVDGSTPSIAALEHAVALATDYGAMLDVLYIAPADDDQLSASTRRELEIAMDGAVERARAALGPRLTRRITSGDPLREIIDTAHEQVDLIVVGTHGRIGRLHALLGSIAEAVVRNAPCPVLAVRDPSPGYQSFAERRHGRPSIAEQA